MKIIAYEIKNEYYNKWYSEFKLIQTKCTFQEYLIYYLGVPAKESYFNENSICFDKNFRPDQKRGIEIASSILVEEYEKLDKK
jgi:hypothetical protein